MLDVTGLLDSLANRFPSYQQVEEAIYRFERKENGAAYAVYFLDLTESLPAEPGELTAYQDRVIAPYYFEGEKSLQWSNYLYFLINPQALAAAHVRRAKQTIERDRRYARKFVVSPADFEAVLKPPAFTPAGEPRSRDLISIWTEELESVGIYDAIVSKAGVQARVEMIQDSSPPTRRTRERRAGAEAEPASAIRRLALENYRPYPQDREFHFRTVNLFVGPNGTGKTSLLEAIELFFCGQNKRSPEESQRYKLRADTVDRVDLVVDHKRPLQLFRDRNLTWYGVNEVKTQTLHRSFALFNFLDTDAAVRLAERADTLEDTLSKLLVGAGAAQLWHEIGRMQDGVLGQLRTLRLLAAKKHEELTQVKAQILEAALITPESDALRARLATMLQRLDWTISPLESTSASDVLVQELSELISVGRQLTELSWIGSPVTRSKMADHLRNTKMVIDNAGRKVNELEDRRKKELRLADEITRLEEAARLAEQVKRIYASGLPALNAERESLQADQQAKAALMTGYRPDDISQVPEPYLELTISAALEMAVSESSQAEHDLTAAKKQLADFQRLRDQSISLAQQLRAIADQIRLKSTKPDQCPLCHAQYGKDELAQRMTLGIDEEVESAGQSLLEHVRNQEQAHGDAGRVKGAIDWITRFAHAASLPVGAPLRTSLDEIERIHKWLSEAMERLATLQSQIESLNYQGISMAVLSGAIGRLQSLGFPLVETEAAANDLLAVVAKEASEVTKQLGEAKREADGLETQLRTTIETPHTSSQSWREWLSKSREQLVSTEVLQAKLDAFASAFPWPSAAPLSELVIEAESIRKVVVDLQTALAQEGQRQKSLPAWREQVDKLEAETKKLNGQIVRLTDAEATLRRILEEHSLTGGVQAALDHNRTSIETIFTRIHSPAEFHKLGDNWKTLVRKVDGTEAGLTQISTGQRAAFALSLFLAQNAQLPAGAPPVVLIDDPVAHVDDLNCLSFLDYLRELVLSGQRQVFFTTANEKLAALFQRKFEFLGSEFRRFNLTREQPLH